MYNPLKNKSQLWYQLRIGNILCTVDMDLLKTCRFGFVFYIDYLTQCFPNALVCGPVKGDPLRQRFFLFSSYFNNLILDYKHIILKSATSQKFSIWPVMLKRMGVLHSSCRRFNLEVTMFDAWAIYIRLSERAHIDFVQNGFFRLF